MEENNIKKEKKESINSDILKSRDSFIQPPDCIYPYIYLGSQYNARNQNQIKENNIKWILNLKEMHYSSMTPKVDFFFFLIEIELKSIMII